MPSRSCYLCGRGNRAHGRRHGFSVLGLGMLDVSCPVSSDDLAKTIAAVRATANEVPEAATTVEGSLGHERQRELVAQVRRVVELAPLVQPRTPNGPPMRVRVTAAGELGWVGDGAYRYDRAQRDGRPWPPIPATWIAIADLAAGPHPWDSAIVNWYEPDAALGWHRDEAEHDRSLPIVTISLGDSCSWAIRKDEESPITRCRLESGDLTVLAGESRGYLHTVERIIANPTFSPLRTRGRVSITLRVAGRVAP